MAYKVLQYVNQFYGQIGGEEMAFQEPIFKNELVGPAMAFDKALGDEYEIVGTVICGDNYIAENTEKAVEEIYNLIKDISIDLIIAGPAFNAGRYGPACGSVAAYLQEKLGVLSVTGMYEENPGVEMYKKNCYIVKTKNSAAGMGKAVKAMSSLAKKLMNGEEVFPEVDEYVARGFRVNKFVEKTGAVRGVEMLVDMMNGREFKTELVLPSFEFVPPAAPVKDMKAAKIALVTDAGLTDTGNSFHLESSRATKYLTFDIKNMDSLSSSDFMSVHGGFDPTYANTNPNVLVPLDAVRELLANNEISGLHGYMYSTTGNGTSIANSQQFGKEIAEKLLADKVDGVILTST